MENQLVISQESIFNFIGILLILGMFGYTLFYVFQALNKEMYKSTYVNKYGIYKILREVSSKGTLYIALVKTNRFFPIYAWWKVQTDGRDTDMTEYKSLDALIAALENSYDNYKQESFYSLKRIL